MQRLAKLPGILTVTAVLICGFGVWWWHLHSPARPAFRTAVVRRGDIAATIGASGTIEPVEVVDVGAQVAGIIKSFGRDLGDHPIDYGSIVAEGAVLAKIDDSVYAADLAVAKAQVEQDKAGEASAAANLDQMKAKLDQAAAEWVRAQTLLASKLLAQVDFDTDKANYEVAKADVSAAQAGVVQAKASTVQAQAALVAAQRNLDFCIIKSPVNGVIIDRRVNVGQTVVASLNAPSLFLIAQDLTKMQIWVSVNEADVGRIKPGGPVIFTCDAFPGREFTGLVGKVRLNATMTQNVVMYTVEVNTDNSDNTLLPYLTANVHFVVRQETNVMLVPKTALRWSPSSPALIAPDARLQVPVDPPGDASASTAKTGSSTREDIGTVWVKEGNYVRPVAVNAGTSDGSETAVTAETLREGSEVVTGELVEGIPAANQNPFLPPVIKR